MWDGADVDGTQYPDSLMASAYPYLFDYTEHAQMASETKIVVPHIISSRQFSFNLMTLSPMPLTAHAAPEPQAPHLKLAILVSVHDSRQDDTVARLLSIRLLSLCRQVPGL